MVVIEPGVQADDELIACLLSERDYAIRSEELAGGLFATVEELSNCRMAMPIDLPVVIVRLESLLEFIAAERRCCPFLSFEIAFEPHGGPLWLRMRALAARESVHRGDIQYPGRGSRSRSARAESVIGRTGCE